jgi:phage gp16-like protein
MKMSNTKLPEAMVEAAISSVWSSMSLRHEEAKSILTAAAVPAMLACVEALRNCVGGAWACLQPGPASCLKCDGCEYEWNSALSEMVAAREILAAFDKSFPK